MNLLVGIFLIILGIINIFISGNEWPEESHYQGIADGKYTTEKDFKNDEIRIRDIYGKTVITYKRVTE